MEEQEGQEDYLTEVKHFMRRDAKARDKELVTERVRMGSATFEFLQRMETRRKKQECMLTVDMRGKVPYECQRYRYRDRTFWLDDLSYDKFRRGLDENNGVFTVGTFEEIVNGEHTYRAMHERERQEALENRSSDPSRSPGGGEEANRGPDALSMGAAEPQTASPEAPEIIPLGYYRDRREPRIQVTLAVQLEAGDFTLPLKTLDLSPRGLKLRSKHPLRIAPGQPVFVTFTEINEERNAGLERIDYQVVTVEPTENDTRIRLSRPSQEADAAVAYLQRYIDDFLKAPGKRRNLDYEDERLTAYSVLAEQYYTVGTMGIPFFLAGEGEQNARIVAVCENENSRQLLDICSDAYGNHDLRGLNAPARAAAFQRLMREDGQRDPLIAIYRGEDGPQIVGDFEFESEKHWFAFLSVRSREEQFRVFKAMVRPLHRPSCLKIYERLDRLCARSSDCAERVLGDVDAIIAAGVLIDITEQIMESGVATSFLDPTVVQSALPAAEKLSAQKGDAPQLIHVGYTEQRREDRYEVRLAAELKTDQGAVEATTRDISVRGMCLELAAPPAGIQVGDHVSVGLPGLLKRARHKAVLKKIPCEVMRIRTGKKTLISLKRLSDQNTRECTEFFKDLIERNRTRMIPELTDALLAAHSRLYMSLAAESAATVPVLIYRDPETADRRVKVGLPKEPGSFAEFFEVEPGRYDFSAVADPRRLSRLTGELRKGGSSELVFYLYKRMADEGYFEIVSACDHEFETNAEKVEFIEQALECDYCFVKVTAAAVQQPGESEINNTLEALMARSPHRGNKLQAEFGQLVAVGDIVDITRQVMEMGDLSRVAVNELSG